MKTFVRIATFHRVVPGPLHVATKFTHGPKSTTALCGVPIAGMMTVVPGDRDHFFDGMCDGCGKLFVV